MQVFLSYAQSDEAFAEALSSQLSKRGLSVWSAHQEVLPGDNLWLQVGEALKKSKAMVVLVSPDSMRSEHVRREIEYALGDPNFQDRVFPVQIRPASDTPWILQKLRTLDAKQGAPDVSESIARVLKQGGSSRSWFTPREEEIMRLLSEGKNNKQVASALKITTRTVEYHRKRIRQKIGLTAPSGIPKASSLELV